MAGEATGTEGGLRVDRRVPLRIRLRGWPGRLWTRPGFRIALLTVVVLRLALGAFAALSLTVAPHLGPIGTWAPVASSPNPLWGVTLGPWQRFDALWYQHIATVGYGTGGLNVYGGAFWPLYPALIWLTGLPLGSDAAGAMLISTVACIGAVWLLYDLCVEQIGRPAALRTVVFVVIAPAAFYLLAPYTESLFLLESVAVFALAQRRHFFVAGLVCAVAIATRDQGVILLPTLALFIVLAWRPAPAPSRLTLTGQLVLAMVPGAVALAVITVAYHAAGFGLGPFSAESLWGVRLAAPWTVLQESVLAIKSGHHVEEIFNLVAALLLVASLPAIWKRLPSPYFLYALLSAAAIWFHIGHYSPLMSAMRFSTVVFPAFMVVGVTVRGRHLTRALVVASAATMLLCFFWYVHSSPFTPI
jgi:hypothetical protein